MAAHRPLLMLSLALATAACDSTRPPATSAAAINLPDGAVDDGTYLGRIDPLGGQWSVTRIGNDDFTRFKGWINFSDGGFLNHGAGCAGGYPAFYRLDGPAIVITRREAIRIGKCGAAGPETEAAAGASERKLASFIDRVARWERPDARTLILTSQDGTRAILTRPVEPYPDLAGRWIIESIGGQKLITERRPPTLTVSIRNIGAHADCNSMGAEFTVTTPGRIKVAGPIVGTAIGCASEDAAEDNLMAQAITSASGYRIDGDRLTLTGGPGLVARRPAPADRRLTGDFRSCGNTLLGGYHEGPIRLTIDGSSMRDNAGCIADYRADGPNLTLRLAPTAACAAKSTPIVPGEPVAIGGSISTLAVTRPDAFGFTEAGQLILRTHRGLLNMCRVGAPPPFGD